MHGPTFSARRPALWGQGGPAAPAPRGPSLLQQVFGALTGFQVQAVEWRAGGALIPALGKWPRESWTQGVTSGWQGIRAEGHRRVAGEGFPVSRVVRAEDTGAGNVHALGSHPD